MSRGARLQVNVCEQCKSRCLYVHCHAAHCFNLKGVERVEANVLLKQLQDSEFVFITARCTLVQSAVLRSHVVCLSVRLSVCNVGGSLGSGSHTLEILETNCTDK